VRAAGASTNIPALGNSLIHSRGARIVSVWICSRFLPSECPRPTTRTTEPAFRLPTRAEVSRKPSRTTAVDVQRHHLSWGPPAALPLASAERRRGLLALVGGVRVLRGGDAAGVAARPRLEVEAGVLGRLSLAQRSPSGVAPAVTRMGRGVAGVAAGSAEGPVAAMPRSADTVRISRLKRDLISLERRPSACGPAPPGRDPSGWRRGGRSGSSGRPSYASSAAALLLRGTSRGADPCAACSCCTTAASRLASTRSSIVLAGPGCCRAMAMAAAPLSLWLPLPSAALRSLQRVLVHLPV